MAVKIGEKIKRLRMANDLTQEELARRTDLTKGYISQLERDLTSPSLATLCDILDVFGETLSDFFEEKAAQEAVVYTGKDRKILASSTSDCRIELLVTASQKRDMEPVLVTLTPGARGPEDRPHHGQEFGYVMEGTLSLAFGRNRHELSAGDCFYFSADKRHSVVNSGPETARILWVVTPPTF